MSFRIGRTAAFIAAAVTVVVCVGGGHLYLDVGLWPALGTGLLFSVTVFATLTFASRTSWPDWSRRRIIAYNLFMGIVLILLGVVMAVTLEAPQSVVLMVVGILAGLLMIVGAVIDYVRQG